MAQQQANRYDAIVVGGGHNGLITAAYLAKFGANVVVLEARHKTGGAADTMEPWPEELPGVKVTTLSYVMSLMPPTIQRDLQLERFGYTVHPQGLGYLPLADGSSIVRHESEQKTRESIARFSTAGRRQVLRVRGVDGARRGDPRAAADADAAASGLSSPTRHQGSRPARVDAAPRAR